MVAMATYFFPKIYVKNGNFSNQAHLFIITFKARIKKNIRNVQNFCSFWHSSFREEDF
jgi:hypothetical protein